MSVVPQLVDIVGGCAHQGSHIRLPSTQCHLVTPAAVPGTHSNRRHDETNNRSTPATENSHQNCLPLLQRLLLLTLAASAHRVSYAAPAPPPTHSAPAPVPLQTQQAVPPCRLPGLTLVLVDGDDCTVSSAGRQHTHTKTCLETCVTYSCLNWCSLVF